jgi:cation:H+ antiporter
MFMELLLHAAVFVAGLTALIVGGDGLVKGAAGLAQRLGISVLVVGLTVVAFGTSAPELAVTLTSGISDAKELAIGNVVGSNIFNILLILGLSTVIAPIIVDRALLRFDLPVMVGSSVLMVLLVGDGAITFGEGALLSSGLVAYITITVWLARRRTAAGEPVDVEEVEASGPEAIDYWLGGAAIAGVAVAMLADRVQIIDVASLLGALAGYLMVARAFAANASLVSSVIELILGIAVVALSARWMVDGATGVASLLGASEAVIGLTVVAAGTSLPEVVTSLVASARGESDLAIGNVVGSNIFNVFCVLGLTGLAVDLPLSPDLVGLDLPFMLAAAVGLWLRAAIRPTLGRATGVVMLLVFAGYMAIQMTRVL